MEPSYGLKDDRTTPPEPTSYKQSLIHMYSNKWVLAEANEYSPHHQKCTWEEVTRIFDGLRALTLVDVLDLGCELNLSQDQISSLNSTG